MLPLEVHAPLLDLAPRHLATLRGLLQQHVPGAVVWAFGSRVGGGAHEGSDVDLVLRHAADPALTVAGVADLRDALQQSELPMLVDVHDWSQLPAAVQIGIERRHVVVRPQAQQALTALPRRAARFKAVSTWPKQRVGRLPGAAGRCWATAASRPQPGAAAPARAP